MTQSEIFHPTLSKTLSEACLNFPKERSVPPSLSSPPLTSDESGEQFSGQPYNCSPNEAMDIGEDFEEKSKKSSTKESEGESYSKHLASTSRRSPSRNSTTSRSSRGRSRSSSSTDVKSQRSSSSRTSRTYPVEKPSRSSRDQDESQKRDKRRSGKSRRKSHGK